MCEAAKQTKTCQGCEELIRGLEKQKEANRRQKKDSGPARDKLRLEMREKIEQADKRTRQATIQLSVVREKYDRRHANLKKFLAGALEALWSARGYRFRIAELEAERSLNWMREDSHGR